MHLSIFKPPGYPVTEENFLYCFFFIGQNYFGTKTTTTDILVIIENNIKSFILLALAIWSVFKYNLYSTYIEIWTGNFCYGQVTFLSCRFGGARKFSSKLCTLVLDHIFLTFGQY